MHENEYILACVGMHWHVAAPSLTERCNQQDQCASVDLRAALSFGLWHISENEDVAACVGVRWHVAGPEKREKGEKKEVKEEEAKGEMGENNEK